MIWTLLYAAVALWTWGWLEGFAVNHPDLEPHGLERRVMLLGVSVGWPLAWALIVRKAWS